MIHLFFLISHVYTKRIIVKKKKKKLVWLEG
jgi:hypothetical protein